MVHTEILAPAAALVVWTLIMLFWALISRAGGFKQAGIDISKIPAGSRGQDLEGELPDKIMWKSHNYTHLMEQPTLFYATAVILALVGTSSLDVGLAWAYVALRIIHSFWQSNVNIVAVRGGIFTLSTLCLVVLAVRALLAALGTSV